MTLRVLLPDAPTENAELTDSLKNNDPFSYTHLIKFERPQRSSSVGEVSGKPEDYSYISDGMYDIEFDDGSSDSRGDLNGAQIYRANKVSKIGSFSETTEAKATNMSLTLSGNALGTNVAVSATFDGSDPAIATDVDLVASGFQEGDIFQLLSGSLAGTLLRINRFDTNNTVAKVTPLTVYDGGVLQSVLPTKGVAEDYEIYLHSEELNALIFNKNTSASYSSYMNREVFIYRAHINPSTGSVIGKPFLIFKGIISKGTVNEDVFKGSTVTWSLTSHWGDFVRVQGRLTSDPHHRALTTDGIPDIEALTRKEYADDYGFIHAETALNVTALYTESVQKTRIKSKKKNFGLSTKVSQSTYYEDEQREVDLRFNLNARMLPVVYGVQRVESIPVFADTKNLSDNGSALVGATDLYILHAICEGEIHGIYDIYIDDSPSVCLDASDSDARDNLDADIQCSGRADQGTVLSSTSKYIAGSAPVVQDYAGFFSPAALEYLFSLQQFSQLEQTPVFETQTNTNNNTLGGSGEGLQHEDYFTISSPIDTVFTVHTGKADQDADQDIVGIAAKNNFKVQNDYYSDNSISYWSNDHRLLDTAYVTAHYTISEGETTVPKTDFVVKGKLVDCYNYDYSYQGVSGDQSNFALGDSVSLYNSSDVLINANVTIIDKWSFYTPDGDLEYRFRFSEAPNLGSATSFYMKNASFDEWHMITYDHKGDTSSVGEDIQTLPTSTATKSSTTPLYSTQVYLDIANSTMWAYLTAGTKIKLSYGSASISTEVKSINSGTVSVVRGYDSAIWTRLEASGSNTVNVEIINAVKLENTTANANSDYTGKIVEVTRYTNDIPQRYKKLIKSYNPSTQTATLASSWGVSFSPEAGDTYSLDLSVGDKRATINPAMQTLDYLTNERYGKGLDLEKDLNLDTFLQSARLCDTRSDITIVMNTSSTTPVVGEVYEYRDSSSRLIFAGTVESVTTGNVYNSVSYTTVTFTDIIGKLGYKWNDWRTYTQGDIVHKDRVVYTVGASNNYTTWATKSSLTLDQVGGAKELSVNIDSSIGTAEKNPIVRDYYNSASGFQKVGYSLYDADNVKYWAYVGWDFQEQRYATRHQCNITLDTSAPVFDNVNLLLAQFNGILRYSAGRYELDVASKADPIASIDTDVEIISEDSIIGTIKLDDKGQKDSFNSMSANIIDPNNKFSKRSISYFNSVYLKEDKGIKKQGSFNAEGITNYYNARMNVERDLESSRYGLTISFKMDQKGYLLTAGSIIRINYARFGWDTNKPFRITSLTFNPEGTVNVTAEEHNDAAYVINKKVSDITLGSNQGGGSVELPVLPTPEAPSNLQANTAGTEKGGVVLTWTNSSNFNLATHRTQVWMAQDSSDFQDASLIATTSANTYTDPVLVPGIQTRYYWVRHSVTKAINNSTRLVHSNFYPLTTSAGEDATAVGVIDGTSNVLVYAYKRSATTPATNPGTISVNLITGVVSTDPLANGWTLTIPASDGNPLYVVAASGSGTGTTDTIDAAEWSSPVILTQDGTSADALTVTVDNSVPGQTTLEFSDGTDATIYDGADGDTKGVVPIFASDASGSGQSFTQGSLEYVNYYEYTNTKPTLPVGGLTWVKYIGTDGDSEGVKPIYADDAAGTNATFTYVSQQYVNFYEWTGTAPATPPAGLSYVKFEGDPGDDGLTSATVFIYQRSSSGTTAPTLPSLTTTYTFDPPGLTNLNNGWDTTITGSGSYLWMSQATAISNTSTDTIANTEWAAAKLMASDGEDGESITGPTGPRTASGYLYYHIPQATAPATPSTPSNFSFASGRFGTIQSGWSTLVPTFEAGNDNNYWYITFFVKEDTFEGTNTTTLGSEGVQQGIGFSGLVTFTPSFQLTDGETTTAFTDFDATDVQSAIENNVTTIDGGKISTNSLSALSANLGNVTSGTLRNNGINYIPDANDPPEGNEKGAFIDLNDGKFVFGDADQYIHYDGTTLDIQGSLNANNITGDVITVIPFVLPDVAAPNDDDILVYDIATIIMPAADHPDGHTPNAIVSGQVETSDNTADIKIILSMKGSVAVSDPIGVPTSIVYNYKENDPNEPGYFVTLDILTFSGDLTQTVGPGELIWQTVGEEANINYVRYDSVANETEIGVGTAPNWNTSDTTYVGIAADTYYTVGAVISGRTGSTNVGRPFTVQGSLGKALPGDITLRVSLYTLDEINSTIYEAITDEPVTIRNGTGTLMGLR